MYEEHFGLTAKPFENTPDPAFFFSNPQHGEALANLLYAVTERKGFVLLTGEIGAGKTLMSRILCRRLGDNARFAHITNSHVTPKGIVHEICREFNLRQDRSDGKIDLLDRFNRFLIEQLAADHLVVLIIDEAQNLPDETVEEVRMLSNLETDREKLIQIILLGQPELRKRIFQPNLTQLRQRIAVSYHLKPLDESSVRAYIAHRLEIVRKDHRKIFDEAALSAIARYSGGTPRVINALCDCSLLLAFARNSPCVTGPIVQDVARQHLPVDRSPALDPETVEHASLPYPDRYPSRRNTAVPPMDKRYSTPGGNGTSGRTMPSPPVPLDFRPPESRHPQPTPELPLRLPNHQRPAPSKPKHLIPDALPEATKPSLGCLAWAVFNLGFPDRT